MEPSEKRHMVTGVRSTRRKRYPFQSLKRANSGRSMLEWEPAEKAARLEMGGSDSGYEGDIDE